MTKAAYLAIALSLSGCATPAVRDRIVEVDKPVAIQPITAAQVPSLPDALEPRPPTLGQAADVLLGKWCAAVGYMLRADPLLRVSAGMPQAPARRYPECETRK